MISIPANIAEGQGRTGAKEFLHHLSIANGSLREIEMHILIAERLRYIDQRQRDNLMEQTATVGRLLLALMRSLRASSSPPDRPTARPPDSR